MDIFLFIQGYELDWAITTLSALIVTIVLISYSFNTIKKIPLILFCHFFSSLLATIGAGIVFLIVPTGVYFIRESFLYINIGEMISVVFLILVVLLTKRNGVEIKIETLSIFDKISIGMISLILGFYIVTFTYVGEGGWPPFVRVVVMFVSMMLLYGVVVYITKVQQIHISVAQNDAYEKYLDQQETHYNLLFQQGVKSAKFVHDAKCLLRPLVDKIECNELDSDLTQLVINLQNTITEINSMVKIKTGSDFIDGHLQFLTHKYADFDLNFKLDGAFPKNLRIEAADMISLFANLLDNAFEAAVKMEVNKKIRMEISADETSLYVKLENSYEGELKEKKIGLKTTKEDKRKHGFGTQIIKTIVEKYSGILKVSFSDNKFITEITFPRTIYKRIEQD